MQNSYIVFAFALAAEAENGIQPTIITIQINISVNLLNLLDLFIEYLPFNLFNTFVYITKMLHNYDFFVNVVTFCN